VRIRLIECDLVVAFLSILAISGVFMGNHKPDSVEVAINTDTKAPFSWHEAYCLIKSLTVGSNTRLTTTNLFSEVLHVDLVQIMHVA
jgi:hypothetical protein